MRKIYFYYVLLCFYNLSFCQEAKLRILGSSNYAENAEQRVILINFEYNPEICNPITQNKTIEIQVNEFIDYLETEKIKYKLLHKENLNFNSELSKFYEVFLPLEENEFKVRKIANSNGIKILKTYYKFSENSFLKEDQKAVNALKKSQKKAIEIAKILNYEIVEIISIDDDTSDSDGLAEILEINNVDDEGKQMLYAIFEKLNNIEANNNATRYGTYNLWVTYKIKALKK